MFRIRIDDQPETMTLVVEGRLSGECVDELRKVWSSKREEAPQKNAIIDLSSVQLVDAGGRSLLSQMHRWGTILRGTGLVIGPLIEEITQ